MVRSYSRNNFVDILRDPLAVTVMASIGLHAVFGAFLLPIISKVPPEGKKIETGTVKVVELTPNELQRIPQVPTPIPTPDPVTLPPVYQPSPPVAPNVPTATTIPATPVRTPTTKASTKPKGTKAQPTQPETKSSGVDFNPEAFINPSPKPTKSPSDRKGEIKPSPKPTPTPSIKPPQPSKKDTTKTLVTPKPSPANNDEGGGGDGGQSNGSSPPPSTTKTTQQSTPASSPAPTNTPNSSPGGSPTPTDTSKRNYYGSLAEKVTAQLAEYEAKYPGIKSIILKSRVIPYPAGLPCSKQKVPYIVYTPVFGPVPQNQDPNFGSTTAEVEDGKVFTDGNLGNKELMDIAANKAVEEALQAEKNRTGEYKNKYVVYSTKVEFDPATCKN